MVLVSALPLRAAVPVFTLFTPREPPLTGSLEGSAPGEEPGSGDPEGEVRLGLAAEDFLPSSPKLEIQLKSKKMLIIAVFVNTKNKVGMRLFFRLMGFSSQV